MCFVEFNSICVFFLSLLDFSREWHRWGVCTSERVHGFPVMVEQRGSLDVTKLWCRFSDISSLQSIYFVYDTVHLFIFCTTFRIFLSGDTDHRISKYCLSFHVIPFLVFKFESVFSKWRMLNCRYEIILELYHTKTLFVKFIWYYQVHKLGSYFS